jgi:hypothetical protein
MVSVGQAKPFRSFLTEDSTGRGERELGKERAGRSREGRKEGGREGGRKGGLVLCVARAKRLGWV